MAKPVARVIDGMKFMWDGEEYESLDAATKVQAEYEKEDFETRVVEEDGTFHVYSRRVVTEIVVDGAPPIWAREEYYFSRYLCSRRLPAIPLESTCYRMAHEKGGERMAVKVASEWLNACSGCEISILNLGDVILDLIPEKLELVHIPALVDSKYFGPLGDGEKLNLPEATVGLISGGVRNEEHVEVVEEMRRKVDILIALGTCATGGGIPAQANMYSNDDVFAKIFGDCPTHEPGAPPKEVVPAYTENVKAVDEIVKVDISIPGGPPHPDWIADALLALLDGKTEWALEERSVCDTCPVIREKKSGGGAAIKRATENFEYNADEPLEKMRCIMEQGSLCVGAVTLAGCAGKSGVPRCIQAGQACRGCFGPIRKGARPLVDFMGALSSIGQDAKTVVDRRAILNRFCGSHGNLRPLPQRKR